MDNPGHPLTPRPPDTATLDRYLAGDATPAETDAIARWAAEQSERAEQLSAFRDALLTGQAQGISAKTSATWATRIVSNDRSAVPQFSGPRRIGGQRASVGRHVAVIAALLLGGIGLWSLDTVAHHPATSTVPPQRFATPAGRHSTVRLADGTTIQLAPSTSVVVSARHVSVEGQAYFSVVPSASRAFTVTLGRATVVVLGTSFDVRHYPGESESRILVADGKVALRVQGARGTDRGPIFLAANTVARVNDSTISVVPNVTVDDYTGWRHGAFTFKNVALRDVLAELSRVYDADIRITDTTLAEQRMTMQMSTSAQSLAHVLDMIGLVANAHYTVDGRTYVVVPGRSSSSAPHKVRSLQQEKQYGR